MKNTRLKFGLLFSTMTAALFMTLTATNVRAQDAGLPLHGFADVTMGTSTSNSPGDERVRGFGIGTIDFYLTPEFEGNVKSLMEIALEPDLGTGAIGIDVERIQVGYTFNDYFTLWAGRYHTPVGIWNTAFHHGAQLQNSIYRPHFIDFEDKGGILPSHSVGLWGKGSMKSGFGRLKYDIYVANGSRLIPEGSGTTPHHLDPNNLRNDKDELLTGVNLSWNFNHALDGLVLGVHGYTGRFNGVNSNAYSSDLSTYMVTSTKSLMLGGYFAYDISRYDILGEFYRFANRDALTPGATDKFSSAGFVQVGVSFLDKWKAFGRWEKVVLDKTDEYFNGQANAHTNNRYALGLRYDVDAKAAVKFETLQTTASSDDAFGINTLYRLWQLQYAVRF
jgi:hypothetical protein